MSNSRFQAVLREHFERFRLSFSETAVGLFLEKDGRILHSGEYGKFREAVSKEFLRHIVPLNLGIGNGFIITSEDEVSKECDVVIYDKVNTPLIQSDEQQRFFPVETVCGIGEIKSTLSKSEFKKAINKLARNKSLRTSAKRGSYINRSYDNGIPFDPKESCLDHLVSFLICKKLDFDCTNLVNEINELYSSEIEYHNRHNLILSVDDGLIAYCDNKQVKKPPATTGFPYKKEKLKNRFLRMETEAFFHFDNFAGMIFGALSRTTILFPEMLHYMNQNTWRARVFDEK